MRRFACVTVPEPGSRVHLDAEVSRHMLQVSRVPRGAEVVLFDGRGKSAVARLVGVLGDCAELEVLSLEQAHAPPAALWACLGVTKGSRFETAIRMAVELGATRIVPVLAGRSIARGDRRARWQRVIDGAVAQSGRAFLPELAAMVPLEAVLTLPSGDFLRWICVPGVATAPGALGSAAVLVGPEGGWTGREVAMAVEYGWQEAGLGATVLRAETAVAAALTRVRCAGPALA